MHFPRTLPLVHLPKFSTIRIHVVGYLTRFACLLPGPVHLLSHSCTSTRSHNLFLSVLASPFTMAALQEAVTAFDSVVPNADPYASPDLKTRLPVPYGRRGPRTSDPAPGQAPVVVRPIRLRLWTDSSPSPGPTASACNRARVASSTLRRRGCGGRHDSSPRRAAAVSGATASSQATSSPRAGRAGGRIRLKSSLDHQSATMPSTMLTTTMTTTSQTPTKTWIGSSTWLATTRSETTVVVRSLTDTTTTSIPVFESPILALSLQACQHISAPPASLQFTAFTSSSMFFVLPCDNLSCPFFRCLVIMVRSQSITVSSVIALVFFACCHNVPPSSFSSHVMSSFPFLPRSSQRQPSISLQVLLLLCTLCFCSPAELLRYS
ncbi:hypothetical protein VTI74DRAFT_5571 [Chaetomium olivicolor]